MDTKKKLKIVKLNRGVVAVFVASDWGCQPALICALDDAAMMVIIAFGPQDTCAVHDQLFQMKIGEVEDFEGVK